MTLGELLALIWDSLYGLWPVRIVQDWQQGVRMLNGQARATLTSTNGIRGTGLHMFVPLFGDLIQEDCNIAVVETSLQTVDTKDGIAATFSIGVKYRIRDLKASYQKVHDHEDTLLEQVRSTAANIVRELLWEDMNDLLGPELDQQIKKNMHGWGVDVIQCAPINLTNAQAIRLIQDE